MECSSNLLSQFKKEIQQYKLKEKDNSPLSASSCSLKKFIFYFKYKLYNQHLPSVKNTLKELYDQLNSIIIHKYKSILNDILTSTLQHIINDIPQIKQNDFMNVNKLFYMFIKQYSLENTFNIDISTFAFDHHFEFIKEMYLQNQNNYSFY